MKRKRWLVAFIIVFVAALLACGGADTTPEPPTQAPTEAPADPTATPVPEPDTPEPTEDIKAGGDSSIEVINNSGQDIWYIYISPSDADDWGQDWLGEDLIFAGGSYMITGIPEGVYDVKAENQEGEALETLWEAAIEGDMKWTVDPVAGLEIINNSGEEIMGLYIADSDSDTWGDDWLGDATIPAGERYLVEGVSAGTYDLRAADADDSNIESIYSVALPDQQEWEVVGKSDLPSGAVMRFEDDFTDNRNDWGSTAESDTVHYMPPADGEYCILIKSSNLTAWEWYEPFRPDEFVAEVACDVREGSEGSCGLGFGPDGDNLFWFEVSPFDQSFALFLLQDDEWQDDLIGWTDSKNIVPYGWNYLSLERVEGVVSVFINGVLVGQVETDLFPAGRIGLGGATYDEENITVCLDNLKVWRIE